MLFGLSDSLINTVQVLLQPPLHFLLDFALGADALCHLLRLAQLVVNVGLVEWLARRCRRIIFAIFPQFTIKLNNCNNLLIWNEIGFPSI